MQNWDDFRFILALSNAGSMTLAAKYLNTDATTVSRRVTRLSSEYGLNLFRKTKGSWVLTNAGQEFVNAASTFNAQLDRLQKFQDNPLSGLSVTLNTIEYIISEFLAPNIGNLDAIGHGLNLSLSSSDRRISLAYGEADMALRLSRPNEGRLIGSRVGTIGLGVYSPNGAMTQKWVGLTPDLDWTPEMCLGFELFKRPPDLRVASFDSIRIASERLGWAGIGPHSIMSNAPNMYLIAQAGTVERDVWSVIHETRRDDQSLKIVRDWVRDCLK